jgi:hypothetical protein
MRFSTSEFYHDSVPSIPLGSFRKCPEIFATLCFSSFTDKLFTSVDDTGFKLLQMSLLPTINTVGVGDFMTRR